MAMRDETRRDAAQADLESLERLLKETLTQPLVAKDDHLAPKNNAPETVHLAAQINDRLSLEVPPLQFDQFHTPPKQARLPQQAQAESQGNQHVDPNEHKLNFEAAMAQLSMIIDPSAGYRNPASNSQDEASGNPLHSFFEDEVLRNSPQPKAESEAASPAFSKVPEAENMPFAFPPPYSVPDMGGNLSYVENLLSQPQHDSSLMHGSQTRYAAERSSIPQSYGEAAQFSAQLAEPQGVNAAHAALDDVEKRLAEQAAYAASNAKVNAKRSYKVFYALAAFATFGLVSLVVVSAVNGRGSTAEGAKSGVPVIAAKTLPTKEKPQDPGGMEIPDQNKQVLSTRTPLESKPAQVLNTTEQPVDLTQITKKEPVRVVFPNGNQTTPPENAPNNAQLEPKRVSSVRLGAAGPETTPSSPTPSAPAETSASPPAASVSPPQREIPGLVPRAVYPPPMPTNPPKTTPEPAEPSTPPQAKVESRPNLPAPPASRPVPAPVPPLAATAPSTPAQQQRTTTNAPLSLTQSTNAASQQQRGASPPATAPRVASVSATGAYAIQLASRPSEASAKDALAQVRNRYAAQLGGKPLSVVSGEVNNQTVYRVRAIGYSQADADAICSQIKSAGGGCFVTKQ